MRYILFAGDTYKNPKGGARDILKTSDDEKELLNMAQTMHLTGRIAWFHIYDSIESKMLIGSAMQAYSFDTLNSKIFCL